MSSEDTLGDPDLVRLRARLVGAELPSGTWVVPAYEAWLAADVLGSPTLPAGELHPMYVFYASVVGSGYDLQDLFDLAECSVEDGPMIGEMDLEQHRALRSGETLHVSARIVEVERKHGRSGTFDTVTVATSIDGADGTAARIRNTYVFPRRP